MNQKCSINSLFFLVFCPMNKSDILLNEKKILEENILFSEPRYIENVPFPLTMISKHLNSASFVYDLKRLICYKVKKMDYPFYYLDLASCIYKQSIMFKNIRIDQLKQNNFELFFQMSSDLPEKDEFIECMINLCEFDELIKLFSSSIEREVESTIDPTTLFRSNETATKLFKIYFQNSEKDYLISLLSDFIKEITTHDGMSFECDPIKMKKDENLSKNIQNLTQAVEKLLTNFIATIDKVPYQIRIYCMLLYSKVGEKFKGKDYLEQREISIGGFIFLRIISPYLVSPPQKTSSISARKLILIAKIIQNIANGIEYNQKEDYMSPFREFLKKWIQTIRPYFIELTKEPKEKIILKYSSKISKDKSVQTLEKYFEMYQMNEKKIIPTIDFSENDDTFIRNGYQYVFDKIMEKVKFFIKKTILNKKYNTETLRTYKLMNYINSVINDCPLKFKSHLLANLFEQIDVYLFNHIMQNLEDRTFELKMGISIMEEFMSSKKLRSFDRFFYSRQMINLILLGETQDFQNISPNITESQYNRFFKKKKLDYSVFLHLDLNKLTFV